jgi:hypothetical protein
MDESSRTTFLQAADVVADLVERIGDRPLAQPGLGEWDLRALIGHTSRSLVTVLTYLDRPASDIDLPTSEAYYAFIAEADMDGAAVAARGVAAGEALGPQAAVAFRQLVAKADERLGRAADDDVIETLAGGMRVDAYLATRTFELVVHGFDIARATGLSCTFPIPVIAATCDVAGRVAARLGHGEALLMALTGRAPLPPGFSVV